ncbi:hypothetical protein T492DRAFT_832680 [Pavlovales sp. CCMP2436]|nr:hypothetical protein T492DRAFT_832680 [Pavlovales sp. CCMP2436]
MSSTFIPSTPLVALLALCALTPIAIVLVLSGAGVLDALPFEATSNACLLFADGAGGCAQFNAQFGLAELLNPSAGLAAPVLVWLAMGGWGGSNNQAWHYATPAQLGVAREMGRSAAALRAEFALGLGGNFYPAGVRGATDARFASTFEQVFTDEALRQPAFFRMVAGESGTSHANKA